MNVWLLVSEGVARCICSSPEITAEDRVFRSFLDATGGAEARTPTVASDEAPTPVGRMGHGPLSTSEL